MEDCVNEEHEDSTINEFLEENDTELYNEVREISIETENEYVLHRYICDSFQEGPCSIPLFFKTQKSPINIFSTP